jgi:hypothetical protein
MQETDSLGFYTGRKLEGEKEPGQSVDVMCDNLQPRRRPIGSY